MATMPFQATREKSPPTMPILVHVFVLIRGVDRHLGIPQVIRTMRWKRWYCAEAAGASAAGMKKALVSGLKSGAATV